MRPLIVILISVLGLTCVASAVAAEFPVGIEIAGPGAVRNGDRYSYTVTLTNFGLEGRSMYFEEFSNPYEGLPQFEAVTAIEPSQGECYSHPTYRLCLLDRLLPGEHATIVFSATPSSTGYINHTLSAMPWFPDASVSSTVTYSVFSVDSSLERPTDIRLSLTGPREVMFGALASYRAVATNYDSRTAHGVKLFASADPDLRIVSVTSPTASCGAPRADNVATCVVNDMAAGAHVDLNAIASPDITPESPVSFRVQLEQDWNSATETDLGRVFTTGVLLATNDADRLLGTTDADSLRGLGGADVIVGGLGDDALRGDSGNDDVNGNGGADHLYGGPGSDHVRGRAGNDALYGGLGTDLLQGDGGSDLLYPGRGRDTVYGGDGRDRVYARDGAVDSIHCGAGRDRVIADALDRVSSGCESVVRR